MKPLLLELARADLIVVYRVKARGWIWFPAYAQLHNVHPKEAKSTCPPPPIDERIPQEPGFVPLESNASSIAAINILFAAEADSTGEASENNGAQEMPLHKDSPRAPGRPMHPKIPVFASDSSFYISASTDQFFTASNTSRTQHTAADGRPFVELSEEERRSDLQQRMRLKSSPTSTTEPVIPHGPITQALDEAAGACTTSE
ncbi:hypothetical protein IAE60_10330 [Pseudoxanthomonas mexicana]|uniref:Uncharacterized protein n=1 Tax=Pseudoxanthomonas mexicana TaxID=128785 RepID=A0A7G9T8D6_PSEMX|nr:hypothetical protein [Pseudoxanthomonas mexicana]QNN76361.1 hypothetical protein IAE60_10330 [Pseudoxanthomonas mexicana]